MKNWRSIKLAKWVELDWAQRALLLEAACALTAAQLAVRLLPFAWIAPRLGRLQGGPFDSVPVSLLLAPVQIDPVQLGEARRLRWALRALARYLPWDAKCLAQAVAGRWMLRRRGLPGRLYLGVDHGQANWLEAHAWLRCGGEFITGEPQHERFTIIAVFSEEAP